MQVDSISITDYARLLERATRTYSDHHGEKVLVLEDNSWVKIFRRKKLISPEIWSPLALRFRRNAVRLAERGIATVSVTSVQYCRENNKHLVWYRPLPGTTLEDIFAENDQLDRHMEGFVHFMNSLHERGVYFRSIHFGNVVYDEKTDQYGLIDVADMRFRPQRLSPGLRARNFKHFSRRKKDCGFLSQYGYKRLLNEYLQVADMNRADEKKFQVNLQRERAAFFVKDTDTDE